MSSKTLNESSGEIKSIIEEVARSLVNDEKSDLDYTNCIRLAFDTANIGMYLMDLNGRFLTANRYMCDIFGFSKEEFEGMSVNDITHPDFLDVSPDYIKRAINGKSTDGEFQKKIHPQKWSYRMGASVQFSCQGQR